MNIGFYDPISERWIKPRPERQVDVVEAMSVGEALLVATQAAARKKRNDKIWEYLKQSAEGCNSVDVAPVIEPTPTIADLPMHFDPAGVPEYEPAESLGYVYWTPKVKI